MLLTGILDEKMLGIYHNTISLLLRYNYHTYHDYALCQVFCSTDEAPCLLSFSSLTSRHFPEVKLTFESPTKHDLYVLLQRFNILDPYSIHRNPCLPISRQSNILFANDLLYTKVTSKYLLS